MAAQSKQDPLTEVLQKIRERRSIKPEEAAKALAQYNKVQEHIKELKAEIQIFKKTKENTNSGKQTTSTQSPRRGQGGQPPNKTINQPTPRRNGSPQNKAPVKIVNGPKHPSDQRPNGIVKQPSPGGNAPRIINAPPPLSDGAVSPRSIKANSTLNSVDENGTYRGMDRRRSSVVSKTFSDNGRDNVSELNKDKEIARLRLQNAQLKVLVDKRLVPIENNTKPITDTSSFASVLQQRDIPSPEKLVREFKKLFEQEWKTSYYELEKQHKLPEDNITELLGVVAKEAYTFCQNIAKQQFEEITAAHGHVTDVLVQPKYIASSSKDVYHAKSKSILDKEGFKVTRRFLKDYRRVMAKTPLPGLIEIFENLVKRDIITKYTALRATPKSFRPYIQRTVELVWYMVLHEPPMCQVWARTGQILVKELFSYYGKRSGATVVHTVWPAILMYRDGPVADKGILLTK